MSVRFGRWCVRTPIGNVARASVTGPFMDAKVIGPLWSANDGGVTFGTNGQRGLCLEFFEPVRGLDPLRWLLHPNLTLTLEDPDRALQALREAGAEVGAGRSVPDRAPPRGLVRASKRNGAWLLGLAVATARQALHPVPMSRVFRNSGDPAPHEGGIAGQGSEREKQPSSHGFGPLFIKKYVASIRGSRFDAHELIEHLAAEPNRGAPGEIAWFEKCKGKSHQMDVGDEYLVHLFGPCTCNHDHDVLQRNVRCPVGRCPTAHLVQAPPSVAR